MAKASAIDLENGSSQSVSIGNISTLNLVSTDFTIEGWYKIENYIQYAQVCGKKWQLRMEGASSSVANMGFYFWNGTGWSGNASATNVNIANWHHIAVVFDLATTTFTFYLDGTADGNYNVGNSPAIATEIFYCGNSGSQNTPWDGLLQNIRISDNKRYTANFTPATELFADDANTLGLWWLDGDLTDQSSAGNNGTFSGSGSATYVTGTLDRIESDNPQTDGLNLNLAKLS